MRKQHPFITIRRLLTITAAVIIVALYLIFLHAAGNRQPSPQATISQLPTKSVTNGGEKQTSPSTGINQGTSTDNQGVLTAPITTSPSQWAVSSSGNITVKLPLANSVIKSGVLVSGSANVEKVQYRLIDNDVGVISQGFINVVSSNFSASISFLPHAKTGRLDVFSTDTSGTELNEVQIAVSF